MTFMTMAYILIVNPAILSNAIFLQTSGDLFGFFIAYIAMWILAVIFVLKFVFVGK